MTNDQERMLEKIQKLLAKAERAGTPEEAETFAAKAQELMTKWTIDEAMLRAAGTAGSAEDIINVRIDLATTFWRADAYLLNAIAMANDCRILVSAYQAARRSTGQRNVPAYAVIYGYESDVRRVKLVYGSLLIQVARASRNLGEPPYGVSQFKWRDSFRTGFATGVGQKLDRARSDVETEMAAKDDRLLPVLVEKRELVDQATAAQAGAPRANRARYDRAGYRQGILAGEGADVGHEGVAGGPAAAIGR